MMLVKLCQKCGMPLEEIEKKYGLCLHCLKGNIVRKEKENDKRDIG